MTNATTKGIQLPALPAGISPATSNVLQPMWDAILQLSNQLASMNGYTGSFVSGTLTVTVVNGIITSVA